MDMKDTNDVLQYGIDSFLNSKFDKANMYFTIVLSKDTKNDIAKFGVMCIDAIEDGMIEAQDMFSIYIFSPEEQKEALVMALDSYQNSEVYNNAVADYIHDVISSYSNGSNSSAYLDKNDRFNSLSDAADVYDTNFLLGKVYEKLGDYDKAIDHIAKAFKSKPFDEKLKKELMEIVRKKNVR